MALIDNLISYWKLDESSGDALDAESVNDGTVNGATQNVSGLINTAYSFDGTDDYVDFGDTAALKPTGSFSISMWVKGTSFSAGRFVSADSGGASYNGYAIRGSTGSKPQFQLSTASGRVDATTGGIGNAISDNVWTHLVLVYDGDEMRGYQDGSLVTTETVVGGSVTYTSTTNVNLGSRQNGNNDYTGLIDEVGIWDKELTTTEITALYNSGAGLAYPFAEDVIVTPAALTLSTTDKEPTIIVEVPALSLSSSLGLLGATASGNVKDGTITLGPGGVGTRFIRTEYPVEEGLQGGVQRQTGRVTNLVIQESSSVLSNERAGID